MYGIRIKTKKAEGKYDVGASKMLGDPVLPEALADSLPQTAMFLMQIRLEDIKELDEENLLPHEGYLYFFLDTEDGLYSLKPIVKYVKEEPTHHIEGFNEIVEGFEEYTHDFLIEFEKCEEDADGNKLLGCPSDWQYAQEPERLLFQLDPLADPEMGILNILDGFIYFFFDEDMKNFDKVKLVEDIS